MAINPFRPPLSFQRRLESRKAGRGSEGMAGFAGWRVGLSLPWLSFPLCGNVLLKPLDSGLRRNDNGGCGQVFFENDKRVRRIASHLVLYSSSFQRRLACMDAGGRAASGTGRRGIQGTKPEKSKNCRILQAPDCVAPLWRSFPLCGNGLSKPLDSGLRRNDSRGYNPTRPRLPRARLI